MEARRLEAAPLLASPDSLQKIAVRFGVSRTTISRWRRIIAEGKSLARRHPPGRPARLDPSTIRLIYLAGPRTAGFDRDRWTHKLFAQSIADRTGIHYDSDHAGRIIHRLQLAPKRARKGEAT